MNGASMSEIMATVGMSGSAVIVGLSIYAFFKVFAEWRRIERRTRHLRALHINTEYRSELWVKKGY